MAFPFIKAMSKIIKLKENYAFRRAYKKGKSFVSPFFVIYIVKNRRGGIHLGITAGKKIGGAVKRNRAKRVITAAFRECLPEIHEGYDFVIVARTRILDIKSTAAANSMKKLLNAAGVMKSMKANEQNTGLAD